MHSSTEPDVSSAPASGSWPQLSDRSSHTDRFPVSKAQQHQLDLPEQADQERDQQHGQPGQDLRWQPLSRQPECPDRCDPRPDGLQRQNAAEILKLSDSANRPEARGGKARKAWKEYRTRWLAFHHCRSSQQAELGRKFRSEVLNPRAKAVQHESVSELD